MIGIVVPMMILVRGEETGETELAGYGASDARLVDKLEETGEDEGVSN